MWLQRDKDRVLVRDIPKLGQVEKFSKDLLAVADESRLRMICADGAATVMVSADNVILRFSPITYVNDGWVEGPCSRRTMLVEEAS